ncbi:hypothetical protein F5Y18DRAFT_410228 [Xylariaceae sp. FL1019]|nr:hypothetical protein F5Y18DRAFT_410228 [Xylariaceae sp. FL1019]
MANPWNIASMTEEKRLKNTFIVATLCSTLIGTFSSSIGLWDRVNDKRKQKQRDTKQDGEIQRLQEKLALAESRGQRGAEMNNPRRRDDEGSDDLGRSLMKSSAMIRREYDEAAERLGRRFAIGDMLTENLLQTQIIALQQTVIDVLQDALLHGHQLSRADVRKLVSASERARDGSLQALRLQVQRLRLEEHPRLNVSSPWGHEPHSIRGDDLYCQYSIELQDLASMTLSPSFAHDGNGVCPQCGVQVSIETPDTYWHIEKKAPVLIGHGKYDEEVMGSHHFDLGQRFIVQCHTRTGEYACLLCRKYRDSDVICRTVSTLIKHVGKAHNVRELRLEPHLKEQRPRSRYLKALLIENKES